MIASPRSVLVVEVERHGSVDAERLIRHGTDVILTGIGICVISSKQGNGTGNGTAVGFADVVIGRVADRGRHGATVDGLGHGIGIGWSGHGEQMVGDSLEGQGKIAGRANQLPTDYNSDF